MKTLYLLVADDLRARLYKTGLPPERLALIYHQRNFGGSAAGQRAEHEEFVRSLCRMLKADHLAGKFNYLAVIATATFLAALHSNVDEECRALMVEKAVPAPAQLAEQDLLASLQLMSLDTATPAKPNSIGVQETR